ncbi:hypothetical protein ALT1000_490016 [Alteromonas macleodii]
MAQIKKDTEEYPVPLTISTPKRLNHKNGVRVHFFVFGAR